MQMVGGKGVHDANRRGRGYTGFRLQGEKRGVQDADDRGTGWGVQGIDGRGRGYRIQMAGGEGVQDAKNKSSPKLINFPKLQAGKIEKQTAAQRSTTTTK